MIGIRKNEADLVTDWIENHCVVPIGATRTAGAPHGPDGNITRHQCRRSEESGATARDAA